MRKCARCTKAPRKLPVSVARCWLFKEIRNDEVPIEQGREVFQASPAKQKRFVEVPGEHHNDLRFREPPASDAVGEFLAAIH